MQCGGNILTRPSRTPWGLVGLLVAAGIVAAFHVGKVPPAIPSIREELGASLSQAGWLLSMVNLVTALGGMAIALTADRFGHRRLVLLGTGALRRGEHARRLRRQRRRPAGLALLRGAGLHRRRGRAADLDPAHRAAGRPAPRDDVLDLLHAGGRRLHDADRGRRAARHFVARRLAGRGRRLRRSCSRPCCWGPCRGASSMPCPSGGGRCCTRWPRWRRAAVRSPSRCASAPIPAAGSPSSASCRPCRSNGWASRPRPPPSSRRWSRS